MGCASLCAATNPAAVAWSLTHIEGARVLETSSVPHTRSPPLSNALTYTFAHTMCISCMYCTYTHIWRNVAGVVVYVCVEIVE